jgi:hypothetical protein
LAKKTPADWPTQRVSTALLGESEGPVVVQADRAIVSPTNVTLRKRIEISFLCRVQNWEMMSPSRFVATRQGRQTRNRIFFATIAFL